MKSAFQCGAARVSITPEESWFPLYRSYLPDDNKLSQEELVGALDPQYARCIALRNADTTILLVGLDLIGVPNGHWLVSRIAEKTQVPQENIFIFATHTHNVPTLGHGGMLEDDPRFLQLMEKHPIEARHQLLYEKKVYDGIQEAAVQALAALKPAKMGIGYTNSFINVNRDQIYQGNGKYHMGFNPNGHSDKTFALIRFVDEQDQPIAVFANYACHCIVMYLNLCLDGKSGSTADLAGFVSTAYEANHPGAVCVWSPAAEGNQNPIFMTFYGYPDPATGDVREGLVKGGAYEYLTVLGARQYDDLKHAERGIMDYVSEIDLCAKREAVYLPIDTNKPRSPLFRKHEERPGFQRIDLSGVMLGNIFLYGIGGELYSDIGELLKKKSPYRHTLICGLNLSHAGYMMNDEELLAPTLFAARTRWLPGYLIPALEGFMKRFTF